MALERQMLVDVPTGEGAPFAWVTLNLFADDAEVKTDGSFGDAENRGGFTVGFSVEYPFHDFGFAWREEVRNR